MARKNNFLKPANSLSEFNVNRIQELIRCESDPVYFIRNYMRIVNPKLGAVPFDLYDYQEEMVRCMHENRFSIILASRQVGKSTVACGYLLWYATFNKNKYILISSNKNSGAMEMIARIRYAYEQLPDWIKPGIDETSWNKHELTFDNGSKIVAEATSADTGRGKSVSLLYSDELAFVRPNIQEEMWTSIFPTLSTGGSAIISSTPNGDNNLFASLWRNAEAGVGTFVPLFISWTRIPDRGENFKEEQIATIGQLKWEQEYECKFVSSETMLFDSVQLLATHAVKGTPDAKQVLWWDIFKRGKTYIVGVDPATGTGRDFSVITVFEFPSLRQIAQFRSNTVSSPLLYKTIKHIFRQAYRANSTHIYFSVENNGVGEGILALFQADEEPFEFVTLVSEEDGKRDGMSTTRSTKMKACLTFKNLFEHKKLTIASPELLVEMKNYIRKGSGYEANTGATDDCISAVLIVMRILEEISNYEVEAFNTLYYLDDDNDYDDKEVGLPVITGNSGTHSSGGFADPSDPSSFDPFLNF